MVRSSQDDVGDNGYPVVEDDVLVGCGARILGPVRVGARAVIGANAVVLDDVPARRHRRRHPRASGAHGSHAAVGAFGLSRGRRSSIQRPLRPVAGRRTGAEPFPRSIASIRRSRRRMRFAWCWTVATSMLA